MTIKHRSISLIKETISSPKNDKHVYAPIDIYQRKDKSRWKVIGENKKHDTKYSRLNFKELIKGCQDELKSLSFDELKSQELSVREISNSLVSQIKKN